MAATASRSPHVRQRPTFALILDMFLDKYSQVLFEGVSDFTRQHGIDLICAVTPVVNEVSPLRDLLGPENADGILLVSSILTNFSRDGNAVAHLLERYRPAPCVSIGEAVEGVPSVTVDNRVGMSNAVRHLIDAHRFRKIAFVRGPESNQDAIQRFGAYQHVLEEAEISYDPELVGQGNWTIASGAAAVRNMLVAGKKFEAVVCANDPMAAGAISALHARGIIVPSDVAVTGFDNINETGLSLTTVEQPAYEMGRRAARMLFDLTNGLTVPKQITLAAELIIRQSCGCMGSRLMPAISSEGGGVQSDATPFLERREAILLAMAHALGETDDGAVPTWLERFFDGFVLDITTGPAGRFISSLNTALATQSGEIPVNAWQSALSVLRHEVLPCLSQQDFVIIAETLWSQAELSIMEAAKKGQARAAASGKASTSGTPPAIRDTQKILYSFVDKLAAIGIERCYVSVFEGHDAVPEWARIIMVYSKDGGAHIDARAERYPAHQLLPESLVPPYCTTLLALPLCKGNDHLGLIFFERGRADGFVYESLRWQLSEQLWNVRGEGG